MTNDEVRFSVEYNLEQQSFVWSDKYRPRKPRFFNRVHTVSQSVNIVTLLFNITNKLWDITNYGI